MKQKLGALTESEKAQESGVLLEKISHFIQTSPEIRTIASYAAMDSEPCLDALGEFHKEINICYPRCGARGGMDFYSVHHLSTMLISTYGIREPDVSIHEKVNPESIDLFLCPAYAYTPRGERLGKGGGFYDRYLLQKRPDAVTLGIVFSCQIIAQIPTEAHDLVIDHVL